MPVEFIGMIATQQQQSEIHYGRYLLPLVRAEVERRNRQSRAA